MTETEKQIILMIGGPGSGKGTQCSKIVEKWNFCHLSSGSLLRQVARENTKAGIDLCEKMKKGKLVDDDTITSIILEKIQKSDSEIILLDGFPRNISQTEKLNAKLKTKPKAIFLNIGEDEMTRRIRERAKTSGRADDNTETVKLRLLTYKEETLPIIEMLKSSNSVYEIAPCIAEKDPDSVFHRISEIIEKNFELCC